MYNKLSIEYSNAFQALRTSTGSSSSRTSEWYTNTQTGTPPIGYDLALSSPSSAKANSSVANSLATIGESRPVAYDTPQTYRGELSPEDKGDGEYIFASDQPRYVQQSALSPRPHPNTAER